MMNAKKMGNLVTFPIKNFDISEFVLNPELPHECLLGTDVKIVEQ